MNITTPLQVALVHSSRGIPVFPCCPATKKPKIKDWPNKASIDPEQIETWWAKWPNAMAGGVTGHKSGKMVLDFDVKDGVPAEERVKIFEAEFGKLPQTFVVRTPSGGLHYYYSMGHEPLNSSAGHLGAAIDVRANGGYIILPGSVRADGKRYEVVGGKYNV